ncbi:MAG: glycoside hydrolase family 2 TIM barrel-domain containing protein, partial [Pleomorphochaeta sp.]
MFNFSYLEDLTKFNEGTIASHSNLFTSHKIHSLNGLWDIKCFKNPQEVPSNLLSGEKLSNPDQIKVPSNLQIQGFDIPQYTNTQYPWDAKENIKPPQVPEIDNLVAIYQKTITLNKEEIESNIIHLTFEGVETSLALFINEQYVGYKEDSFTPSSFEINKYLKSGENLISCMVTHYCSGSWLEDQDFWRLSGIFRPVNLEFLPKVFISDVFVNPELSSNLEDGNLKINLKLNKKSNSKLSIFLSNSEIKSDKINLEDFSINKIKKGNLIIEKEIDNEEQISLNYNMGKIKLYNHETPYLYTLFLVLEEKNNIYECALEFGYRKIEVIKNVIYLNNKRLVFHGVNRHEFNRDKAKAIDFSDIKKDLLIMKENNIDSIRTSHYPNQNIFYSLCNRMGFYVIDEVNIESHGTTINAYGVKDYTIAVPYNRKEWNECTIDRANNMAQRDKNHPSIIMFSCGNESSDGTNLLDVSKLLKKFGNRIIHYENVSYDSEYEAISDVESQMYTKPKDIEKFLIEHPKKPFMLCEYSHAMGNSCGNLKEYTDLARKYENYHGGFIWDFIDQSLSFNSKELVYGGLKGKFPTDADFCCNGIISSKYEESFKLKEIKKLYSPIVFENNIDSITIINEYCFTSLDKFTFKAEIILDGKYIKDKSLENFIETDNITTIDNNSFKLNLLPGDMINLKIKELSYKDIIINLFVYDEKQNLINDNSFTNLKQRDLNPYFTQISDSKKLIWGKDNVGCNTDKGQFLIKYLSTKANGILLNQINILEKPISLEFWRAPNSNDLANNNSFKWAVNKLRSLYQKLVKVDMEEKKAIFEVLCYDQNFEITYSFENTGKMQINVKKLTKDSSDMPCFGLSFALNSQYNKIRYFGNTKGEAYIDRKESSLIGFKEESIDDQYVKYVNPQECGNKTDLRYIELLDKDNHGLRITTSTIFEASFLPYSSHELEEAKHFEDLKQHNFNSIRILHGQSGIAGDDTWGAPIHEQYLYHGIEDSWSISFEIV